MKPAWCLLPTHLGRWFSNGGAGSLGGCDHSAALLTLRAVVWYVVPIGAYSIGNMPLTPRSNTQHGEQEVQCGSGMEGVAGMEGAAF